MNFKKALERKRAAAKSAPVEKPVSEMSEQELDRELERAQGELRKAKEQELASTRESAADAGRGRPTFTAFRKRRPSWK